MDDLSAKDTPLFKNNYMAYLDIFYLDDLPVDSRLLVLDADIIICDRLSDMYNMDLHNLPVAAARNNDGVGCNTGVVLWDMDLYRSLHLSEKLINTLCSMNKEDIVLGDQSVFNKCLFDNHRVCHMDMKYNSIISNLVFSYDEFVKIRGLRDCYSNDEYNEALQNPAILHCINGYFVISPWYYEGEKSLRIIWNDYIEKSQIEINGDNMVINSHVDRSFYIIFIALRVVSLFPKFLKVKILHMIYKSL